MQTRVFVVLGGGIDMEGNLRGPSRCRVAKVAELFQKEIEIKATYDHIKIIVSSEWSMSLLLKPIKPKKTIAKAMHDELINKYNIPMECILLEEKSRDTMGNIFYVKNLFLKKNDWKELTIITSNFHVKRTKFLADKILGPNYKYDFSIAEDGLDSNELTLQNELEENQLKAHQKHLGLFKNGDDEAIANFFATHPAYSINPQYSIEQYLEETNGKGKQSPFHEYNQLEKDVTADLITKFGMRSSVRPLGDSTINKELMSEKHFATLK